MARFLETVLVSLVVRLLVLPHACEVTLPESRYLLKRAKADGFESSRGEVSSPYPPYHSVSFNNSNNDSFFPMSQTHKLWFFYANYPSMPPRSVTLGGDQCDIDFEDLEPAIKARIQNIRVGSECAYVDFWELKEPVKADQVLPPGKPLKAFATRVEMDTSIRRFLPPRDAPSKLGHVRLVVDPVSRARASNGKEEGSARTPMFSSGLGGSF
ncbi:hypothetical protein BJ138DRAFT_1105583 [Hygrophoropsis aurantiaca]|uniref:Uncharacterized protein n=1 Tax=Hygrophoropsis aurantiaca TaxID=72124 RepID=A0ACB7ZYH3_9AGAM|nr:hypothetical protein BJ138DRAFT_1105583 [Hygrophoropsis aurantiaca]